MTFSHEESIEYISNIIGEKIRRLPQVVIDGNRIGGYYDIMEFLINKKLLSMLNKKLLLSCQHQSIKNK